MLYPHSQSGYSLVEVLIAIAVLLLSIVGPLTIASKSLQTAYDSEKQVVATYLAQEGIEAMSALRQDSVIAAIRSGTLASMWNWSNNSALNPCFASTGCNFDVSNANLTSTIVSCNSASTCRLRLNEGASVARYNLSSGAATPFTRVIQLNRITTASNNDAVRVTSRVSWESASFGSTREVVLTTILFNVYENL